MSKKNAKSAKSDVKKAAYAAKQEKEGRKVINWIFGILIALGVVFAIYSAVILS